jgi:hypothetical protein
LNDWVAQADGEIPRALIDGVQRIQVSGLLEASPSRRCTVFSLSNIM